MREWQKRYPIGSSWYYKPRGVEHLVFVTNHDDGTGPNWVDGNISVHCSCHGNTYYLDAAWAAKHLKTRRQRAANYYIQAVQAAHWFDEEVKRLKAGGWVVSGDMAYRPKEMGMLSQKLVIGRIVHCRWGTSLDSKCRPAIVVEIDANEQIVTTVFQKSGTKHGVRLVHDRPQGSATWHWPDECEEFTAPSTPKRPPGSWWVERGRGEYNGQWILMPDHVHFSYGRRAIAQSIADSHNKAMLDEAYKELDF